MTYKTALHGLGSLREILPVSKEIWKGPSLFYSTWQRLEADFDLDMQNLHDEAEFIFATDEEMKRQTRLCVKMVHQWTLSGKAPSLAALCAFALDKFSARDDEYVRLVMLASVLGEMENNLSYHSNMHYRKVVLQMIRLIANHNEIYADTVKTLNHRQICLLLAAACVHDIGHDGRGNTVEGVHERARLERYSYELLEYYMKFLGFDDATVFEMLKAMLIATDVSPLDDPRSPMAQMKAAYRYHFQGERSKILALNLAADLKPLERSAGLTMMSLLLHEADIATSAGLEYALTKYETGLLRAEIADGVAQPGHILLFLEKICNRQVLSDAGQRLYAANMARIYALAERDYLNGNEPYPELMRSDFMLGQSAGNIAASSTAIN